MSRSPSVHIIVLPSGSLVPLYLSEREDEPLEHAFVSAPTFTHTAAFEAFNELGSQEKDANTHKPLIDSLGICIGATLILQLGGSALPTSPSSADGYRS